MAKIPTFVPWEERPIEFLCARRFAELFQSKSGWTTYSGNRNELHFHELEGSFDRSSEATQRIEEAKKYAAELAALPNEELMQVFNAEYSLWKQERAKKAEEEERELFFNRQESTADLKFWSKMAIWTLDEAVALSLGKDPGKVNRSSMSKSGERYVPAVWLQSEFPREYARRTALVQRAKVAGMLRDQIEPEKFIRWAADVFDNLPDELIAGFLVPTNTKDAESLASYPPELRAAIEAYRAVRSDPNALSGRSPRQALERWLSENKPEIVGNAKKRVLTIANWSPQGGAPKTPGGEPTPGG
ncbi:MAG: hypothetical protein KF800_06630 [Lysobacter sp.]|nr:hypothetical protein [Lysobacter sp.]